MNNSEIASAMPEGVQLEDRPCPLGCASSDSVLETGQDLIHGLPGHFTVVQCAQCGLIRTNPRPTPETIGAYYPSDYAPYLTTATSVSAPKTKWRHRFRQKMNRFWGRDMRRLPPVPAGHMLEIGCAAGNYLREMIAKGWTAEGIEYSDGAAQVARLSGLHVQTSSIEGAQPPLRRPDIVTAWMVLEHLHEPIPALKKIRSWVSDDAYLVGVVPDANAFDHRLFGNYWYALQLPTHLYHYTEESLSKILRHGGWEMVQIRWQANEMNLLRTLEYYLSGKGSRKRLAALRWFKDSRATRKFRRWLGWLLAVTHQSGRMEFWARPLPDNGSKS